MNDSENLVKSKQRVGDHGEVFTPAWMVRNMLDLVKDESERIDSRFLEPACGDGNFLREVLRRKLATTQARYGKNEFERRHYGLLGLMCIYGIELLADNAQDCREHLAQIFAEFIGPEDAEVWIVAARQVLAVNIVQADALTMLRPDGSAIIFPEWGYLGKGRFQRRDFRYENLTQRAAFGAGDGFGQDSLFADASDDQLFTPAATYPPLTVVQIAHGASNA
ncbi:SAM-dependent DNA methyltransferase [Trueperella pyogenes]|uniref:SAM-dependent DNA methyltransferase n=1 Tax=Trueperella pyogenes TaxID=1661 RepID=UPI00345D1665